MKQAPYLLLLTLWLSSTSLLAQATIYLDGKPDASWDHDQPRGRVVNCYLHKPIHIRPYSAAFDEKTDQVIYTLVSQNEELEITPHPAREGWFVLKMVRPASRVKVRFYAHTEKPMVYKVPVERGTNRIALRGADGRFDKSKVEWHPMPLGPEPILMDDLIFHVRE